jgi:GH24 family phage-related lysozyme (muramidase)
MADKSVYLNFGADVGGLESAMARAQAGVRATANEMRKIAVEMQKTGAAADSDLGQKLAAAGARLGEMKAAANAAREAMAGLGGASNEAAKGAHASAHAHGANTAQIAESIHVVKALGDEIAAGQNPLRALALESGRIFQILSGGVSATVLGWGAVAAGVLAAAGAMAYLIVQADQFRATSDQLQRSSAFGGFGISKAAADEVTTRLTKVAGLSSKEAQEVAAAFGLMQGKSKEVFDAIAVDIDGLAKVTGDKPAEAAKKLIAMFGDQKLSVEALTKVFGDLSEAQRTQYERALQSASPLERQAALQAIVAAQIKKANSDTLKARQDEVDAAKNRVAYTAEDQVDTTDFIQKLEEEIAALKRANDEAAKLPDLIRGSATAADQLVAKFDEVLRSVSGVTEQEKIAANIAVLREGLQGATGDAAALIRQFEGYKEVAYMDRSPGHPELDHWAVGYGQHAIGGKEVTEGTVVSREAAEADLAARIAEIQRRLEAAIGESWGRLSDKVKASLTSIAYNYGGVGKISDVIAAARSGDERGVADAIAARAGDNKGVNAGRRAQEAANITRDGAAVTDPARTAQARDAIAELTDKQRQLNEARNGSGPVALAELENLEKEAANRADAVDAERRIVAALEQELGLTASVANRRAATVKLDEARIQLRNRENAATEAGLALDAARARATGDPARQKAADLALADFKIRAAGADVAARDAAEAAKIAIIQRYAEQERQLTFQTASERIAAARAESQSTVRDLELEFKARQITEARKFELTRAAYARERAETLAAYGTELAVENLKLRDRQRINAEIAAAEREFAARSKQLQLDAAAANAKAWASAADKVSGIIDGQVAGVLRGTTSIRQAFANMAESAIEDIVKLAIHWAAQQIAMTAATLTATAAQTSAHAAGAATAKAIDATTVQADAGRAAAGAYAAVAGVPIIGPILAPAAAAVAYAGTLAVGSFDIGAWSIPHDQLAMVHRNELVMPAAEAGAFRTMLSDSAAGGASEPGGASGDSHVHFNISTMDSASFGRFLHDNSKAVMGAISRGVKTGDHLAYRNLSGRFG